MTTVQLTVSQDIDNRIQSFWHAINCLIQAPFRVVWDLALIIAASVLTFFWLGFLFGSVAGVILVLIFAPGLFVMPFALLVLWVNALPERPEPIHRAKTIAAEPRKALDTGTYDCEDWDYEDRDYEYLDYED